MRRLGWVESGLLQFRVLLARKADPSRLPPIMDSHPGHATCIFPVLTTASTVSAAVQPSSPRVRTMRQPVVVPMLLVHTLVNARGYQTAPEADGPHGGRVAPFSWHRVVMQGPADAAVL